jgi:hypothetical protein
MLSRLRHFGASGLVALLLVGCSTGTASPSGGGGAQVNGPSVNPPSADAGGSGAASGSGAPGGSGAAGGQPVGDPCSLLTQAQVAGVLGVAVDPGSTADDPHACSFDYHDPADELGLVSATITTNVRASQVAKDCASPSSAALGLTITVVSGVGDVACFVDGGILGTHLTYSSGGQGYEMGVLALGSLKSRFDAPTAEGMEQALALDALAH